MRVVIIDGDSIAYIAGFNKSPGEAESCVTRLMAQIMSDTKAEAYELYIEEWREDKKLFRRSMWSGYKNRDKSKVKQTVPFLNHAREFMLSKWNARVVINYEAEDVALRRARERRDLGDDVVIGYIDKDLLQYPGEFYYYGNIDRKPVGFNRTQFLSERDATLRLWRQVITGDPADTIPGIKGVGEVGAVNAVHNPNTAMIDAATLYKSKGLSYDYFITQYNMIKLRDFESQELMYPLTEVEYEQI